MGVEDDGLGALEGEEGREKEEEEVCVVVEEEDEGWGMAKAEVQISATSSLATMDLHASNFREV